MDILISAIAGDLVGRSMSFFISKYFQQQPDINKIAQRLQSVVLRIDTVVEEAQGRDITNQGMLCQLKMLRQEMYRGHYVLDALRFRAALDEEGEEAVSHSLSVLRKSSPAKRLRFSRTGSSRSNREALLIGTNRNIREELQQMVDTLEDTMDDMKEFLFFLELYPRILRQPYGTYLFLDNCMFGRKTERQWILNFLMCPSATPDLAILPIVGPIRVGKSTLVENIYRDESVRDRFSMILFFPEGSLKDEGVVDLDYLPQEAYWHFFKSLLFRSTNPDEQPKLATMAMEIALELRQCFTSAHIAAGILRDNFNARFWRTVLDCVRESKQTNLLMFDQHPYLRLREDAPVYCWRLVKRQRYFLFGNHHQSYSDENVPKINLRDIILGCGGILPCGEFEALAWRSRIPPYYNYTITWSSNGEDVAIR